MKAARFAFAAMIAAATLSLAGCVTEYEAGQEPLKPAPGEIPSQPASLIVNRIAFHPTLYARDMNGNGMGDRFDATIYLWSEPYPFPLHAEGTLTISMFRLGEYADPDAEPLREWVLTPEQMQAARAKARPGPCYYIEISLLDDAQRAGDELDIQSADLVARFAQNGRRDITSGLSTVHLEHPGR